MLRFTRRSFLAGSAALAASPALGAVPASGEVDVVIVGAGAAGIAAARRVAAAGRRYALIEAGDRIGGRCITDTRTFGSPFDRGARALHQADTNPIAPLAPKSGLTIDTAPRGQKLRIGRRFARESELEDFLAAQFRASRAIVEAGRGKADVAAARVLPKEFPDWKPAVDFVLGPYMSGKDLTEVSAADFGRASERDHGVTCRQGLGSLLAKLGEGLPVQLSTPVQRIEWLKSLEVETSRGTLRARAVIITVSTGVLASGGIKFTPELPKRQQDAFARLKLGTVERIALEIPGNPLGLGRDELVFEKSSNERTAALVANAAGGSVCLVDVGGKFATELAKEGDKAMVAFASDWIGNLYGTEVKSAIKRTAVTRWSDNPLVRGAHSVASPGGADARKILNEPIRDRVFFAGEATHETLWGTLGGAYESGTRAAEAALRKIGALREDVMAKEPAPKKLKSRRRARRESDDD